ncbi:DHH family phosphoesterase [Gorillibacterium timonense]|uniref:DHH family phosphoesterase n=1 Tax=Gorillibacterium timonense TaxID=1689269 RepID=UPI00071DE41E|nr:DHH family phosphoesterase [Gorillibacterium timonense]
MPKKLLNRWHGRHMIAALAGLVLLSLVLLRLDWRLTAAGLVLTAVLAFYTVQAEKAFRKDLNRYAATLSNRIKKVGNVVLQEMPIGIILYDEEKRIEWHNPFVGQILGKESVIGDPLGEVIPAMKKKDRDSLVDFLIEGKIYQGLIKETERLIFLRNITEQTELRQRYEDEKLAIGIVLLDNLEEATQGMDDQTRSILLAKVTSVMNEWAQQNGIYLRRLSSERHLLLMNQRSLQELEQDRFSLLDDVRDMTAEQKVPITLSIGIASGTESITELGQLAQSSLDMALGRGGDQVAVKVGDKTSFYGGRTNAVEKRTRVRARVIAHALRDLIKESDNVVIMGHKLPDLDSIGAAIGVLKAVQAHKKEGFIIVDSVGPSIQMLMNELKEENQASRFITPDQATQITTARTLAVVVDTHKSSMVSEPRVLNQTNRVVVIDHHRRGEDYLQDAMLIYMEPYASSTCELVTELLQYIHERLTLGALEATALLAGMMMDTKNFSLRTGSRTFDAASYLRRSGADLGMIQQWQKEDLTTFVSKADIIKHAEILYDRIAIAAAEKGKRYNQVLFAQVADTLLNMSGIIGSFVIGERTDGLIGISARSTGDINVQLVMEQMGGGGHLSNAATQVEGEIGEVTDRLKRILAKMMMEEGLAE